MFQLFKLGSLLALSLMILSCSSFQGPGSFRGPPQLNTPPSNLSWQGSEPLFQWPVSEIRMSRGFQTRGRPHYGLDLTGARGTPIYAAASGRVIYAGSGFSGYGRLVIVEHGDEWASFYSHLEKILVGEGQHLASGQALGTMGDSGRATGVHLHFEVRKSRRPVDPLSVIPAAPQPLAEL